MEGPRRHNYWAVLRAPVALNPAMSVIHIFDLFISNIKHTSHVYGVRYENTVLLALENNCMVNIYFLV